MIQLFQDDGFPCMRPGTTSTFVLFGETLHLFNLCFQRGDTMMATFLGAKFQEQLFVSSQNQQEACVSNAVSPVRLCAKDIPDRNHHLRKNQAVRDRKGDQRFKRELSPPWSYTSAEWP